MQECITYPLSKARETVIWRINGNGVDERGPQWVGVQWDSDDGLDAATMLASAGRPRLLLLLLMQLLIEAPGIHSRCHSDSRPLHPGRSARQQPAGSCCSLVVDIYRSMHVRPTGICIINVSVWTRLCLLLARHSCITQLAALQKEEFSCAAANGPY